ncbi:MAG: CsbD family protein [Devosia sp.]
MHKDQVQGAGKEVRGAIKEAAGKVTGDAKLQVDGKLDKAEGAVQRKVGDAKEAARDALKH